MKSFRLDKLINNEYILINSDTLLAFLLKLNDLIEEEFNEISNDIADHAISQNDSDFNILLNNLIKTKGAKDLIFKLINQINDRF
jgi:hypothetical protein